MLEEAGGKGDVQLACVGIYRGDEVLVGGNDSAAVEEKKCVKRGVIHAFYLPYRAELVIDYFVINQVLPGQKRFVGVVRKVATQQINRVSAQARRLLFRSNTVQTDDVRVCALLAPFGQTKRRENLIQPEEQKLRVFGNGKQVVVADDMQFPASPVGARARS